MAPNQEIILFDIGNVVIRANHQRTHQFLEEWGVASENAKLFYKNDEYLQFSRGKITGQEFYQTLVNQYLKQSLSYEHIVEAHDRHIYEADQGVIEILQLLKNQNIPLAFITDTNVWQTKRERELVDVSIYSDSVFRSHEIGMLKVDSGAFEYVCRNIQVDPEKAVLIDDSPEKIAAAEKAGLQTIHFVDALQLRGSLDFVR